MKQMVYHQQTAYVASYNNKLIIRQLFPLFILSFLNSFDFKIILNISCIPSMFYEIRFSQECIPPIFMPFIIKRNTLTVFNIVRSQNLLRNVS